MSVNFKFRKLFWIALPLALTAGCASDSNQFFTDTPAPVMAPITERQAASIVVASEVFGMFLADTNLNYLLWITVNKGVLTMGSSSPDGIERQRIVNRMWELNGVTQVKDGYGVNVAETLALNAGVQDRK